MSFSSSVSVRKGFLLQNLTDLEKNIFKDSEINLIDRNFQISLRNLLRSIRFLIEFCTPFIGVNFFTTPDLSKTCHFTPVEDLSQITKQNHIKHFIYSVTFSMKL